MIKLNMTMYKHFRFYAVLFPLFVVACAPKIELNIDQTSLIPKESAVQYLQSYEWVPPQNVAKAKEHCGPFTEVTLEGHAYETLTLTFYSGPFKAVIYDDNGSSNYPVCFVGLQGQSGLGGSEDDVSRATRLAQAFISLGGKYKYSGF